MERAHITTRLAITIRVAVALATFVAATACGNTSSSSSKSPEVSVISPSPNAEVQTNVSISIQANISGDNITRADVYIDGQPYAILTTDDKTKGMPSFPINVPWAPSSEGVHVLQFVVYGADAKVLLKSDPVIFKAVGKSSAAAGTTAPAVAAATILPTQTTAPTLATAVPLTNAVLLTDAVSPTASAQVVMVLSATVTVEGATPSGPALTVTSDSLNVRSGPGTWYAVVGQLQNGATVTVRGKSADGTWWQIDYSSAPGGVGWVSGELVQTNSAASDVPVITAEPTSTGAPVTALPVTATSAEPTATPAPTSRPCDSSTPGWMGSDSRYPFCVGKVLTWFDNQDGAHRYENMHDVPLSLSWDIWGVDSVWLVFEQDNSGYCDFTKKSVRTLNQQVATTGSYSFNVKDFPGGATLRIYLNVRRTDGQVVEFGDKRLCIF
jgi:uncharacterized protein YraI